MLNDDGKRDATAGACAPPPKPGGHPHALGPGYSYREVRRRLAVGAGTGTGGGGCGAPARRNHAAKLVELKRLTYRHTQHQSVALCSYEKTDRLEGIFEIMQQRVLRR